MNSNILSTLLPNSDPDSNALSTLRPNNNSLNNNSINNNSSSNSNTNSGKRRASGVQRILERSKVNLSRSKSELGEQHKKMISHLTKSRNELSEQNKRILASLSSGVGKGKKFIPQGLKIRSNSKDCQDKDHSPVQQRRDLDSVLVNLGINPHDPNSTITSTLKVFKNGANNYQDPDVNIRNTLRCDINSFDLYHNKSNGDRKVENEEDLELEKQLEEGYGEFEFIDDREMTLTRKNDENDKDNLAEEIFDELNKSNTFKRDHYYKPSRPSSAIGGSSTDLYNMKNDWEQKYYSYFKNNSVSTQGLNNEGLYYVPKTIINQENRAQLTKPSYQTRNVECYGTTSRRKLGQSSSNPVKRSSAISRRQRRLSSTSFSGDYSSLTSNYNEKIMLQDEDDGVKDEQNGMMHYRR